MSYVMDRCEERKVRRSASEPSQCGQHEDQTKVQRQERQKRPDSSSPSCASMKSRRSMGSPLEFKRRHSSEPKPGQQEKPDYPVYSHVSWKSNKSMGHPLDFNRQHPSGTVGEESSEGLSCQSTQEQHTDLDFVFMLLEERMFSFVKAELKLFQRCLSSDRECLKSQSEDDEEKWNIREALLKFTLHQLRKMKKEKLADHLQSRTYSGLCRRKLKSKLKTRFQCVFEGIAKAGNPSFLEQIYTELYITEGGTGVVNNQHEVRQIETASRKPAEPEKTINCENIFKPSVFKDQPIRTVLTTGVAGIGKTVLTQKFSLDWAEDKANQDIHFTFPFTFRELNVLKEKKFSLVDLVHHFFTETKEAGIRSFEHLKVVFIFDGLDECRLPLDFHNNDILTDVTESTSVDVLLTNLISGKLLPSAQIWITTRPAAANQIPPECIDMVTDVRGFADPQKEEYFQKRFRDEESARRIISHLRTSRSLDIMCHIPVFCWITATVLENVFKTGLRKELPKTLTEMYIHFLVVQCKLKEVKYEGGAETDPHWSPGTREMIESLGKLAFEQLQKGNLIFYKSDLIECGIDVKTASVFSGVLTQIFREESGLYLDKVFCFIHLSVQEFLAALHVHLTFINSGINLLEDTHKSSLMRRSSKSLDNLHQSAVNRSLESSNGHLDMFLRFLLGLSHQTTDSLLQHLVTKRADRSVSNKKTVEYIKKKINKDLPSESTMNLFHCLNELKDHSLIEEIQQYLNSGSLSIENLSPAQWSALVFILLSSGKDLDEFDLTKYTATEEALLRMLPVIKTSRKAILSGCNLSERSCDALVSVLSSMSSCLRDLDLSNNKLQDSGLTSLSAGLESENCTLESLSLSGCRLWGRSCEVLVSVLSSQSSCLRDLDLSNNDLLDSGLMSLFAGLESENCTLETISLSGCMLSEGSCEALASVLSSQSSSLRDLDLSNNDLLDSGLKLLSEGLKSENCALVTLSLSGCQITEVGCTFLASALTSNSSHLRELDLSYNHLGDSGEKLLTAVKQDPKCKLDRLRMDHCGEERLKPGLRKYACKLTLDPNAVQWKVRVINNRSKVETLGWTQRSPNKSRYSQILCTDAATDRCYCEVEWKGDVLIGVTNKIRRRRSLEMPWHEAHGWPVNLGERDWFESDVQSWGLLCCKNGYFVLNKMRQMLYPSPASSNRVAVYMDHSAGIISFYRVSRGQLFPLHTFHSTFTEPLFLGFGLRGYSSVSLCEL